ncbi:MAG: transglutaminase family protein [Trichlorobacter sp.]|mgnify:FL=1
MRYRIEHQTILTYQQSAVKEHHIEIRLTPRADGWQVVHQHAIKVMCADFVSRYQDYFGNTVDCFDAIAPHTELSATLVMDVETMRVNPFAFEVMSPLGYEAWYQQAQLAAPQLYDYILHRSLVTPSLDKVTSRVSSLPPTRVAGSPLLDQLINVMEWVCAVLQYETGASGVHSDLLMVLENGAGVCQDFAHLFLTVVRSWGIPARYVMGYMDPGIGVEGEQIATHAWAEVLLPDAGWIGFDPVHQLVVNDQYITVAVGRDSYDAAPLRGSYKGSDPGLPPSVSVTILNQ